MPGLPQAVKLLLEYGDVFVCTCTCARRDLDHDYRYLYSPGPQSRSGDKITIISSNLSPERCCGSERVTSRLSPGTAVKALRFVLNFEIVISISPTRYVGIRAGSHDLSLPCTSRTGTRPVYTRKTGTYTPCTRKTGTTDCRPCKREGWHDHDYRYPTAVSPFNFCAFSMHRRKAPCAPHALTLFQQRMLPVLRTGTVSTSNPFVAWLL